jgi:hypothetical protein
MKKFSTLLILFLALLAGRIQAQQVKNVRIETDDEKVTIIYDLIASGSVRIFNVCLRTGSTEITPKNTTGAIGKNRPTGINQKIEWYYANDGYTLDQLNNLKIEVVAIDPNKAMVANNTLPKPNKIPVYAGLGTVSLTGLGLVIAGLTKHSDAIEKYDIYKSNTDPNSTVYTELGVTRSDLYNEANKTNKSAQLMMYGGAAVFAGAGAVLVNRLIWIKRIEKRREETQTPDNMQCSINPPRFEVKSLGLGQGGVGLGFAYRF